MDPTPTDIIRLTLPAAAAAVRIARAGAAGLATRAGFTYHEVEQIQLAVGEAAALLAPEPGGRGTLTLTFSVDGDGMRIDLDLAGRDGAAAPGPVPPIAGAVLDAAVDRWHVLDGGRRVVLQKRLSDTDDDE
ncbi:MAG TPA: hypothetical protein VFZ77_13860 [Acidimicrobiales bacterium]